MASSNLNKIGNKIKRQEQHLKAKKLKESAKRDDRLRRRRHEDKNPHLRAQRQAKNVPQTIDSKRTWDEVDDADEDEARLDRAVNVLNPKRRKVEKDAPADEGDGLTSGKLEALEKAQERAEKGEEEDEDRDSMLDSDSEGEDEDADSASDTTSNRKRSARAPSEAPSAAPSAATAVTAATDMTVRPEALRAKFPSLFNETTHDPKVLLTTSINSTLHHEAELLTTLFPNCTYIKRTANFHGYKYSIREIASYASAPSRGYTHVVVLNEDLKKPKGLDIVHLPHGPMFHFSISNWIPGARLPGHGNPTNHYPELILNGFKTPLGLLAAHLFKSLFPPRPEIQGRQVVTLHNQRDYIFVRRHRYVFRDKKQTEKVIHGTDGKPMKGAEDIRAGLQELGPRFTLKLRRVDKGIQRASGQEWEWKAGDEKVRTRFSL
ncbi:Ribosome production factor 1 [Fulvia fulva]|uniref:Ribosome production factor 1 n=1 Tax=Passalora fulva TaxID=5499 RepID=A0A9Q8UQP6_PASFU|nr:Ribosome production factor 1 [Fulvia fulva]KAK4621300.1 Ribosome production factor 1 [Fulvia fulva]KAK4622588.1 Ribosome production factor 1 [Fulvia fulva]UJO18896.1 Ribosome production factor 1 [Fulvia fulva]WPV16027.1 Ribosome production factor 1 [Fulvia fulva]WPV30922.1 Ribosome production factor 1 [Fulvia fulva]